MREETPVLRNGLLLAITLAFFLAVGVSTPYGISYSDGLQLSDKSALAADKKKKKKKDKKKKKRPAPR